MLSLNIRRLEQGPSKHEFPDEMSAFVLQKSQVQGLAGTIDAFIDRKQRQLCLAGSQTAFKKTFCAICIE